MQVLVDFTGQIVRNPGGRTYARYLLGGWRARYGREFSAAFSSGEVPSEFSGADWVRELPPSLGSISARRLWDLQVGVPRLVRAIRPDAVYFPGNVISLALPRDLPKVVAVRGTVAFHYPGQFGWARTAYLRAATRQAVSSANRVIVPSSATADDLMRFTNVHRWKVVVIPHGVDLDRFSPAPGEPTEPGSLLFVSRPYDYKGLATVFRALRLLDHPAGETPRLLVADGGLPAPDVRSFTHMAESVGVADSVQFLGRVDHEELVRLYRKASALVLPTAYESFGNTFLEAAACGCPVITGGGHGIDEVIGPVADQVDAHDHRQLAAAISRIAEESPSDREERAVRMRQWAERFSWDRTVDETREVIREAIG
jgi:glycogen(starch) synthase